MSPLVSGLLLAPTMFGAAFGTLVAGHRVERVGRYRHWPIAGSVLMTIGMLLLATLGVSTPAALAIAYGGVLGLGVGFVMQTSLLALQNSVEHRDLGIATSTALLFRILGGAIGPSVFGAVLNAGQPTGCGAPRRCSPTRSRRYSSPRCRSACSRSWSRSGSRNARYASTPTSARTRSRPPPSWWRTKSGRSYICWAINAA